MSSITENPQSQKLSYYNKFCRKEISLMSKKKRKDAIETKDKCLQAPSHHLSTKANPRKMISGSKEKLQAKNEPVYLAARVEERAPKFAKR